MLRVKGILVSHVRGTRCEAETALFETSAETWVDQVCIASVRFFGRRSHLLGVLVLG